MNTVNKDRETLKRLVESYGKQDVLKFVNHLNEDNRDEDYWRIGQNITKIACDWLTEHYDEFCDETYYYEDKAIEACKEALRDAGYDIDTYGWAVEEAEAYPEDRTWEDG
jgi:hypothetical protein